MTEREVHHLRENLATRVNYSPRARSTLGLVVTGGLAMMTDVLETNYPTSFSPIVRDRMFDFWAVPVGALLIGTFTGDPFQRGRLAAVLTGTFFFEWKQRGQDGYDEGDFVAYGLGAAVWVVVDELAKKLHDSGVTDPLYKVLGITRRVGVSSSDMHPSDREG